MVVKSTIPTDEPETLADLHERLGFVALHRIRSRPFPGTATEEDLLQALQDKEKKRFELVDGSLVEKEPMGWKEALWATFISAELTIFLREHDLGVVVGADGLYRLKTGLIRLPDVSFVPWSRMPSGESEDWEICPVIPTLAVEVLSRSNRSNEIDRKISEYFAAGVKLCWVIDPKKLAARVYSSATRYKLLDTEGVLEGGKILPGFRLPLSDVFREGSRRKKK